MIKIIKDNKAITCILLISFLFQLTFLANFKDDAVQSDAIHYDLLAKNLLHNKIFSLDGKTIFIQRSPGYPLFILSIYVLFGENVIAVQFAQILLMLCVCFLVYEIGGLVFNRSIAVLAASIIAFHPVFICQFYYLLSEPLMTFLITLSVYLSIIYIKCRKSWHLVLLGCVLGFAALTRPIVLLLPFFAVFILIFFINWKKTIKASLLVLVPFILISGAWVYRNYKHTTFVIPLQIMGGRSLWSGTYIPGKGFDEDPQTTKARNALTATLENEVNEEFKSVIKEKSQEFDIVTYLVMRKMGDIAVKNIISKPLSVVKILPFKFTRLYIGSYSYLYGVKEKYEQLLRNEGDVKNAGVKLMVKSIILVLSFLIITLSIIGLLSSLRNYPYILPVIILLVYWNMIFIFFETMTRYSIPILPIIILLAARGIYFLKRILLLKGDRDENFMRNSGS